MTFPSGWQLILLLAVLVILFGSTKLPAAARSIGQSLRIFKAETKGLRGEDDDSASDNHAEASPTTQQQKPELPTSERTTPATEAPRKTLRNSHDTEHPRH